MLAATLSVIQPGLGQLYCGRLSRALSIAYVSIVLSLVLLIVLYQTGVAIGAAVFTTIVGGAYALWVMIDAWLVARKTQPNYQPTPVNRMSVYIPFCMLMILGTLTCAVGGSLLIRQSYESFRIPNDSMAPGIPAGGIVMASKPAYLKEDPELGDVVIFRNPDNRAQFWVKRVVAGPGQTVEIRDGKLYVDSVVESPVDYGVAGMGEVENTSLMEVPPHHVFVLGDNRATSKDSRHFGPIPITSIYGQVTEVIWPSRK